MDFNLRKNVKFQTGTGVHGRRRRGDVQAPHRSGLEVRCALGLPGRAHARRGRQGRRFHGALRRSRRPTAGFPYLTSTTTYQAIILPKDYQIGTFTKKPTTTGAFRMTSFDGAKGATFERFDGWWGGKALLDGVDATFYAEAAAADVAHDLEPGADPRSGAALGRPGAVQQPEHRDRLGARRSTHRQVPMRVDMDPFKDKRARQAVALTHRPARAILKTGCSRRSARSATTRRSRRPTRRR